MKVLRFSLNIPPDEALRYYRGQASTVIAYADNGQSIQFPAQHIRPYISQSGIQGRFMIRFDDNYKLIDLNKI